MSEHHYRWGTSAAAGILLAPVLLVTPAFAMAGDQGPDTEAATGVVLLANENALPLGDDSVALITAGVAERGVSNVIPIDAPVTLAESLGTGVDLVNLGPALPAGVGGGPPVPSEVLTASTGEPGLLAEYFGADDLSDALGSAVVGSSLLGWAGHEGAVAVRVTAQLRIPADGAYRLTIAATGAARMLIDGVEVAALGLPNLAPPNLDPPKPGDALSGPDALPEPLDPPADGSSEIPRGPVTTVPSVSTPIAGSVGDVLDIEIVQVDPTSDAPLLVLGWQVPDTVVPANVAAAVDAAGKAQAAVIQLPQFAPAGAASAVAGALPVDLADLIRRVAEVNPRTVVVLDARTDATLQDWKDIPAAIIHDPFGAVESSVLAKVLRGTSRPGGRLAEPIFAPRSAVPGQSAAPEEPLFAAGFGLDYWNYELSHLTAAQGAATGAEAEGSTATVTVSSKGTAAGAAHISLAAASADSKEFVPAGSSQFELAAGEVAETSVPLDLGGLALDHPGAWPLTIRATLDSTGATLTTQLLAPTTPRSPRSPVVATRATGWLSLAIEGSQATLSDAEDLGDRLRLTGALPTVTVVDGRQGSDTGWSVTATVSRLDADAGTVPPTELGWAPALLSPAVGVKAGPEVAGRLSGGPGLADAAVLGWASADSPRSSAQFGARLVLETPADTAPGTYRGTLTLSLFPTD